MPTRIDYEFVEVAFERDDAPRHASRCAARTRRRRPSADDLVQQGAAFWPLQLARELDDAILHLRLNELEVATIVFKSDGDPAARARARRVPRRDMPTHWLAREIRLNWKRVLKRIDMTSRSLVTLIEPGSCFAGTLAELVFAADRSYMLIGTVQGDNRAPADDHAGRR